MVCLLWNWCMNIQVPNTELSTKQALNHGHVQYRYEYICPEVIRPRVDILASVDRVGGELDIARSVLFLCAVDGPMAWQRLNWPWP